MDIQKGIINRQMGVTVKDGILTTRAVATADAPDKAARMAQERIDGLVALFPERYLAERVDEWRAADDRTLEIRLKRPFALMLEALAKPDANVPFIMPARIAATPATEPYSVDSLICRPVDLLTCWPVDPLTRWPVGQGDPLMVMAAGG